MQSGERRSRLSQLSDHASSTHSSICSLTSSKLIVLVLFSCICCSAFSKQLLFLFVSQYDQYRCFLFLFFRVIALLAALNRIVQELMKHVDESEEEYKLLDQAVDKVKELADTINEAKERVQHPCNFFNDVLTSNCVIVYQRNSSYVLLHRRITWRSAWKSTAILSIVMSGCSLIPHGAGFGKECIDLFTMHMIQRRKGTYIQHLFMDLCTNRDGPLKIIGDNERLPRDVHCFLVSPCSNS